MQQKAKDKNEQVILGDVSRLFNCVAAFAKDNKLKKKLTEEKPEINPQGATDVSDLWDMTTDHRYLYLRSQEDPSVEITSPYPVAILLEDDTIDFDQTPPEEPVAILKFPKFTSKAIHKFYDKYCKERVTQVCTPARYRTEDPADAEEFIPNEWTPGKLKTWKATLKRMVEKAEEEGEIAATALHGQRRRCPPTKLVYNTPGNVSQTPVKRPKKQ